MSNLCQYNTIFGKIGEGAHSLRLFNIAIVDLVLTIIVAYCISLFISYTFLQIFIFLFICGIILHQIFCVDTTINVILFGKLNAKKHCSFMNDKIN